MLANPKPDVMALSAVDLPLAMVSVLPRVVVGHGQKLKESKNSENSGNSKSKKDCMSVGQGCQSSVTNAVVVFCILETGLASPAFHLACLSHPAMLRGRLPCTGALAPVALNVVVDSSLCFGRG